MGNSMSIQPVFFFYFSVTQYDLSSYSHLTGELQKMVEVMLGPDAAKEMEKIPSLITQSNVALMTCRRTWNLC